MHEQKRRSSGPKWPSIPRQRRQIVRPSGVTSARAGNGSRVPKSRGTAPEGLIPLEAGSGGSRIDHRLFNVNPGVTLPRPGRFSFSVGFAGAVPLSMPLGLMFGRPFRPFRRAISSRSSATVCFRVATSRIVQPAEPQARTAQRGKAVAAAHDAESPPRRIGAREKCGSALVLPLLLRDMCGRPVDAREKSRSLTTSSTAIMCPAVDAARTPLAQMGPRSGPNNQRLQKPLSLGFPDPRFDRCHLVPLFHPGINAWYGPVNPVRRHARSWPKPSAISLLNHGQTAWRLNRQQFG